MNMFGKIWLRVTTTGASEDIETQIRKKIIITNKVCLTLIALCVIFCFFWLAHGEVKVSLVNVVAGIVFLVPFLLNAKKHYTLSRLLILLIFNISMFVIVGGIGKASEGHITFFILAALGFILFDTKERVSLFSAVLMPLVLYQILYSNDFHLFNLNFSSKLVLNPNTFYYANFGFIIVSMFYLSQETGRAEKLLSATNDKLQASQIFLKSIIENLPLAFYTRDMDNRYTLVNSEFEKLFSVDKNEVLFKTSSEIFPKSKVEFLVLFDHEVFKRQSSKIFEASIGPEEDSEQKTFLCTKFPILGPKKETFGICGIALDISDRIAAQKQLDEQRALIIDNVRLTALTDMANGMSHEINNPLAILEIIHGKLSRQLNSGSVSIETLKDVLDKMNGATKRIGFIVASLRKFIERPKDLKRESVVPGQLIDEIMALNMEKIKQAGIELSVHTTGFPFNILCQASEIRQVIHSLISNSYDAIANTPNASINVSTFYLDGVVKIMVQDSGPGVPEEFLNKLFQPFFTTKDVGVGQGLSLSVARGIIKAHGGKLIYDSANELTTFVIELPRG